MWIRYSDDYITIPSSSLGFYHYCKTKTKLLLSSFGIHLHFVDMGFAEDKRYKKLQFPRSNGNGRNNSVSFQNYNLRESFFFFQFHAQLLRPHWRFLRPEPFQTGLTFIIYIYIYMYKWGWGQCFLKFITLLLLLLLFLYTILVILSLSSLFSLSYITIYTQPIIYFS